MTAEPDALRLVPVSLIADTMNWMARAYERIHSLPRISDTDLAEKVGAAKERLRPYLDAPAVQPAAGRVKPLDWHKPTKRELEEGGRDCALWIAPGFGGEYAIQADGANFILWRIDDPYAFDTFPTVEAAKAHAEADWQNTISRKLAALAHPPAQASESGGEDWLALVMCNVDRTEGSGLQPVRTLDELDANVATYWRDEARSAIQGRSHLSALSPQPGPASEGAALSAPQAAPGEGEQS